MTFLYLLIEKLSLELGLENFLIAFFLIFARCLAFTLIVPFLGGSLIPALVRVAIAATFAFLGSMLIYRLEDFSSSTALILSVLFIKEAFIGLVFGFFSSLIFYCFELSGQLIDFLRGASMSRLLLPHTRNQSSAMGSLLFQLSLVLFIALGLHRALIHAFFQSLYIFKVSSFTIDLDNHDLLILSTRVLSQIFIIALQISLPIIFMSFLIDLSFGLLNRAAPQINAYFLSLPAKMIMGLLFFLLLFPFLIEDFGTISERIISPFLDILF
jgi:flagellar biosynthetic protein FliR